MRGKRKEKKKGREGERKREKTDRVRIVWFSDF
jgi:hypothetical protein